MSTGTTDMRAAYMRRYREEHREHLLAKRRERYHADYGGKVRDDACRTDGLTATQRWYSRHKDELNAKRRAERAAAKASGCRTSKASDLGKNSPVVTPGRVCTDCVHYLQSYLCSESFFEVVSAGIRIAETCMNYERPGQPEPLRRPRRKKITATAPEPAAEPEPEPVADTVPEPEPAAEPEPEIQEGPKEGPEEQEKESQEPQTQPIMSNTKDQKEDAAAPDAVQAVAPSKTPEAQNAYYSEYYAKNRERILAKQRERYHADIDGARARKREDRARLRNEIASLREDLEKVKQHTARDEKMPSAATQCPMVADCPGFLLTPAVADSIRAALETMRACGIAPELRTVEGGVEITMRLPDDPAGGAR